jgi:hypothetical protein
LRLDRLSEWLPARAPKFEGRDIRITFRDSLRTARRRLYSGARSRRMHRGQEVHAATFIRQRLIVLDSELDRNRAELPRILLHELFHFAWVRLGNAARHEYEAVIGDEMKARARGELGWSSEMRKNEMRKEELRRRGGRAWREYACESFCDTAAWLHSGIRLHKEFTLGIRFRKRRKAWFEAAFGGRAVRV